ncbi:MAG: hypothetical protein R2799_05680 [Crocinitomicaceae bacterium]
MKTVEGQFTDDLSFDGKGKFTLAPSKTIDPVKGSEKVFWDGYVNGDKVRIIQEDEGLDFSNVPEKYVNAIAEMRIGILKMNCNNFD